MSLRDSKFVLAEIQKGGIRSVLAGLLWACPFCKAGRLCKDCHLRAIDNLHNEDKGRWFLRVPIHTARKIVHKHILCARNFEQ